MSFNGVLPNVMFLHRLALISVAAGSIETNDHDDDAMHFPYFHVFFVAHHINHPHNTHLKHLLNTANILLPRMKPRQLSHTSPTLPPPPITIVATFLMLYPCRTTFHRFIFHILSIDEISLHIILLFENEILEDPFSWWTMETHLPDHPWTVSLWTPFEHSSKRSCFGAHTPSRWLSLIGMVLSWSLRILCDFLMKSATVRKLVAHQRIELWFAFLFPVLSFSIADKLSR